MNEQFSTMNRQLDWLIEIERPRLIIELKPYDPFQTTNIAGEYSVAGTISMYGRAVAKIIRSAICVSTDRHVAEDVIDAFTQAATIENARMYPDAISELPSIILPNGVNIGFTAKALQRIRKTGVRGRNPDRFETQGWNKRALYCRARIEGNEKLTTIYCGYMSQADTNLRQFEVNKNQNGSSRESNVRACLHSAKSFL